MKKRKKIIHIYDHVATQLNNVQVFGAYFTHHIHFYVDLCLHENNFTIRYVAVDDFAVLSQASKFSMVQPLPHLFIQFCTYLSYII